MQTATTTREAYIELTEHSPLQVILFFLLALVGGAAAFIFIILPVLELFFGQFLDAKIVYSGEQNTSYYLRWIITIAPDNGSEAIYRLNPMLAFMPFIISFGLGFAFYITAVLPASVGFVRQKIQREIVNSLDKVARQIYHERVEKDHRQVESNLMEMDIRHLHELAEIHNIPFHELETLRKALIWRRLPRLWQTLKINHAIRLYMRNYFTIEYGNPMLGIVYIGAAVLIIVIGLRGLKFIPASEPSIIIFALGLEFVLLILYALTVIYSRDEDVAAVVEAPAGNQSVTTLEAIASSLQSLASRERSGITGPAAPTSSVNSREVENILRIFITRPGKKNDRG
jgi:hypothetical protein